MVSRRPATFCMQTPETESKQELGKSQLFCWSWEGVPGQQFSTRTTGVFSCSHVSMARSCIQPLESGPDLEALTNKYFDHGIWYFDLGRGQDSYGSISPALSSRALSNRGTEVLDQALHRMRRLREPATAQSMADTPFEVHALEDLSGRERESTVEVEKLYQKLAASYRNVSDWRTNLDDPSRVWLPGPAGAEISFQEKRHNGADDASAPSALKGHTLIYSVSKNGSSMKQVSPSSDYSYGDCSCWRLPAKRFACIRENPLNPPEIVSFNSDSSAEQVLTDLNPEVRSWRLPKVELMEWTDSKGNPGFGYLYRTSWVRQRPLSHSCLALLLCKLRLCRVCGCR